MSAAGAPDHIILKMCYNLDTNDLYNIESNEFIRSVNDILNVHILKLFNGYFDSVVIGLLNKIIE